MQYDLNKHNVIGLSRAMGGSYRLWQLRGGKHRGLRVYSLNVARQGASTPWGGTLQG